MVLIKSPGRRTVIALGFTATGTGAYQIDTETSGITRLADGGVFARLCPDGKTLVRWGEEGIIKRNLDTGEESVVVKAGPHYALSPDEIMGNYQSIIPEPSTLVLLSLGVLVFLPTVRRRRNR